jgi:tellurite resistance protein
MPAYGRRSRSLSAPWTTAPTVRPRTPPRVARPDGAWKQTIALRKGTPLHEEEKLGALLAVARQIAAEVGEVDEDTWQQAVVAGWSREELAELFAHVIANIFTNYFNHYAHTELDMPAAPALTEATS